MCFQIIPLCPACEDPSGLREEILFAEDVCDGKCAGDEVVGTTTRLMTQAEVDNPDFDCLTPGCVNIRSGLTLEEEEAEVRGARDLAKQFLRERHENCLSLCILPFYDPPSQPVIQVELSDSDAPQARSTPPTTFKQKRGRRDRPWSKKRGKPWCLDEEAVLWKLRRRGMEFEEIAVGRPKSQQFAVKDQQLTTFQRHIDRTERGCYDRYNKLRNEGFGRAH